MTPAELARATLRQQDDPKAWAKRILANPTAYPAYSRELASEALKAERPRQPGEDDA